MDINIICYLFILVSVVTGVLGLLINYLEPYLPISLIHSYTYGKFHTKVLKGIVAKCEVPKRSFKHFYYFAGPASSVLLCIMLSKYLYNKNVPEIMLTSLDILLGTSRKPLIPAENAILAIILLNVQCWKRAYETNYISVFSDQKINISHYLLGFIHYFGVLSCIVGESQAFVRGSNASLSWYKLTTTNLICAFIFLWSTYMQFRSNIILAGLRKNKNGTVVSHDYKLPRNGLFEYISNPLQFTEILMYLMLSMILWQASTCHYVTLWVMINQAECAFLNQRWNHKTFKDYPKERKILIPYIW